MVEDVVADRLEELSTAVLIAQGPSIDALGHRQETLYRGPIGKTTAPDQLFDHAAELS